MTMTMTITKLVVMKSLAMKTTKAMNNNSPLSEWQNMLMISDANSESIDLEKIPSVLC